MVWPFGSKKSDNSIKPATYLFIVEDTEIYESRLPGGKDWYKLYQGQKWYQGSQSALVTVKLFSKNLAKEAKQEWDMMKSDQYQKYMKGTDLLLEAFGSSFDPDCELRSKSQNQAWKGHDWIAMTQLPSKCPNLAAFDDAVKMKTGALGHMDFTEGDFIKLSILTCDAFHLLERASSAQFPRFVHGFVKPDILNFKITSTGLKVSIGNFFYSAGDIDSIEAKGLMNALSLQETNKPKVYHRGLDFWNYLMIMIELLHQQDPEFQRLKKANGKVQYFSTVSKLQDYIRSSSMLSQNFKKAVIEPFFKFILENSGMQFSFWFSFNHYLRLYEKNFEALLSSGLISYLETDGNYKPRNAPGFHVFPVGGTNYPPSAFVGQNIPANLSENDLANSVLLDDANQSTKHSTAIPTVGSTDHNPFLDSDMSSLDTSERNKIIHTNTSAISTTAGTPRPATKSELQKPLTSQPTKSEIGPKTKMLDSSKPNKLTIEISKAPREPELEGQQGPNTPHQTTPRTKRDSVVCLVI